MDTTAYWFIASLADAFFLVAAAREKIHRGVYILGVGAVLLAFRWPIVLANICLNVDEGFMLAGGSTLARFAKYWIPAPMPAKRKKWLCADWRGALRSRSRFCFW
jgi:hypothetical protein